MSARVQYSTIASNTSAPSSNNPISKTIDYMISQFVDFERRCDEAIERQDNLSRSLYRRIGTAEDETVLGELLSGTVLLDDGTTVARQDLKYSDIKYNDFKQLSALANRVIPQGFPVSTKRFILNTCSLDLSLVEELEVEITLLKFHMREIEHDILETTPTNLGEALSKLKFIVGLLLDGQELDLDYFAYLVDECTDIIAEKMKSLSLKFDL